MKAWKVEDWCTPREMTLTDLPVPEPGQGQALVRVHAAALNFFDVLMISGKYQVKPPLPFTPGCEMAGEVVAAGPGSVFRPGDRVCGQPGWGAFGEYVLVENDRTDIVPDGVPMHDAAVMPVVYPTAHVALQRRGNLQPGEWVLVTAGAGGVGIAAIQLAKAWGARVIGLAGGEAKCAVCREQGADLALDYTQDGWVDLIRTHTNGHGIDVIVDPVGGEVYDQALKVLAWEGRAVIIGFAGGTIQKIAANRLLLKNASAVGAVWGGYLARDPQRARAVVADCFDLYAQGKIRPAIMRTYGLHEVPDALEALSRRDSWGKLVIDMKAA
ncbi:NADPH2:quinone reductase [Constrictibacter sp. MBR-5]|jgi:NADPH2:quinone reductase|uniref:NADPH:quinone oxidoreductase family protein n=1 Tax=Constrictibacter sp. MBR-5 TaxID=3156467 RepID=UPI003398CE76